ncbi:MAG: NYN domain-containing protein [Azoarcus sp. PHD]|nr:MAG: NYN domain-containing protein [Azoarcus sp. PHD]
MTRTLLFVDADNQSPALVAPLARVFKSFGRSCTQAIVAGNGKGDRVRGWEQALQSEMPGIEVRCHVAPVRKQSADVRLMFELAAVHYGEADPATLIVVVSRDDLLVAATEYLASQGHTVLIALGSAPNAVAPVTDLPLVVLPLPQATTAAQAADVIVMPTGNAPDNIDVRTVTAAVAKIRQTIAQDKKGGYSASAVGQLLSEMGHDKAARTKILRAIPNFKESGVGGDKRLIF